MDSIAEAKLAEEGQAGVDRKEATTDSKDSKEGDSKDSKKGDSKEGDSKERDSKEGDNKEGDSKEEDNKEGDSRPQAANSKEVSRPQTAGVIALDEETLAIITSIEILYKELVDKKRVATAKARKLIKEAKEAEALAKAEAEALAKAEAEAAAAEGKKDDDEGDDDEEEDGVEVKTSVQGVEEEKEVIITFSEEDDIVIKEIEEKINVSKADYVSKMRGAIFQYADIFCFNAFVSELYYELSLQDREFNTIKKFYHPDCLASFASPSGRRVTGGDHVARGFLSIYKSLNIKHNIVKATIETPPPPRCDLYVMCTNTIQINDEDPVPVYEIFEFMRPDPKNNIDLLLKNYTLINRGNRPLYLLPECDIPVTNYDNVEECFKPRPPTPEIKEEPVEEVVVEEVKVSEVVDVPPAIEEDKDDDNGDANEDEEEEDEEAEEVEDQEGDDQ